jgi:phosphoribosylglycinamide formyltransferase 1
LPSGLANFQQVDKIIPGFFTNTNPKHGYLCQEFMPSQVPSIIVFASGNGSNAKVLHAHSMATQQFSIAAIVCNQVNAGIVNYALEQSIPLLLISKEEVSSPFFRQQLQVYQASLLVLAGFLCKIPASLLSAFPNKIVNIHPSLLPKYGGVGMYGKHVHQAVFDNAEKQTGITIHLVNEQYDKGEIILQKSIDLSASDTSQSIAAKVLELEHLYYKDVILQLLIGKTNSAP